MTGIEDMPFRDHVVHITDLHFWQVTWHPLRLLNKRMLGNANLWLRRRHHINLSLAEVCIDAFIRSGATTVLVGGDLTTTALAAEFRQAAAFLRTLKERGFNVIALPGNHDVYTAGAARKQRAANYLGEFMPESPLPARILLPGGTPVVLAPTVCPNWFSSKGHISEREIAETARLVAESPPGAVLVLAHYPVLSHTENYRQGWNHRLRQGERLRAALGETGRNIFYLAGHVHRFSLTRDSRYPQMTHLTTDACFYRRGADDIRASFTELLVRESSIGLWQHRLAEEWIRDDRTV